MTRDELLQAITLLGREFRRRGMREHAARLRLYWLAVKRGLAEGPNFRVEVTWTAAEVQAQLEQLQVDQVTAEARQLRNARRKGGPGRR